MSRPHDLTSAAVAVVAGVAVAFVTRVALARLNPNDDLIHSPVTELRGVMGFFLGHVPEFFGVLGAKAQGDAMLRHFAETRAAGKQACTVQILSEKWLVPLNPRDIEYILLKRDGKYIKPAIYDRAAILTGSMGLVVIRDEVAHSRHRRALNPAFSVASLRETYDDIVVKRVVRLVDELTVVLSEDGRVNQPVVCDLEHAFDSLSIDITAEAAFRQTNVGELNVSQQFATMLAAFSRAQYLLIRGGSWLPTKDVQICQRAQNCVRKAAAIMFQRARASAAAPDVGSRQGRKLLVDYLAEAGLDASSVEDHCLTMLLAGHETTSVTLQWTTYLLATHQDWQQQLFEEVNAAVHETGVPSLETVRGLTLLRNVIRESMRLFPASSFLNRLSIEDDVLPHSGIFVPKGTEIAMYIFALHRDPAVWGADAHEFNPNRWLDTDRIDNVVGPGGYLPFSLGKRNCIGKEFALNELLATLAVFVRRFHVAWPDGQRHPVRRTRLALAPTEPIKLLVSCRQR